MSNFFVAGIIVFCFSNIVAEEKCVQHGADITITSGDDIRNVSDIAIMTCMDDMKPLTVFDLSWDDGHEIKVTGSGAKKVVEAKFSESGKKIHLSLANMKNTQCHLQIGKARPLNCSSQGKDEEEKKNSNIGVGVGVAIGSVVVVVVVVVLIRRKHASRPHSGPAANGTVLNSFPEAESSPKEPAETPSSAEAVGLLNPRPDRQEQLPDYFSQPQESGRNAMEPADMRTRQNQDEVVTTPQQALVQLGKLRCNR